MDLGGGDKMKPIDSFKTCFRIFLCAFFVVCLLNTVVSAQGMGSIPILQRQVPYTVTKPGSYYLISNLIVNNPNVTVISIESDNVTIDLNGFSIIGSGKESGGLGFAINTPNTNSNVLVRNGAVDSFGYVGVHLGGHFNNRAENLRVSNVKSCGILVGRSGFITNCQASYCGEGINCGDGSLITNNVLFSNGVGINMSRGYPGPVGGVAVIGNSCRLNVTGITAQGEGCRIEGNTISLNETGIDFSFGTNTLFARNFLQGNNTALVGESDDIDGGSIDFALSNIIR